MPQCKITRTTSYLHSTYISSSSVSIKIVALVYNNAGILVGPGLFVSMLAFQLPRSPTPFTAVVSTQVNKVFLSPLTSLHTADMIVTIPVFQEMSAWPV